MTDLDAARPGQSVAVGEEGLSGHVIICGLQDDGFRVVEQLRAANLDVVVVDATPDPRLVGRLTHLQVKWLDSDSRSSRSLRAAGIASARAIICMESDDLHTVATALLAHEIAPGLRVVAQMRNPAVGRALVEVGVLVLDLATISAPAFVEACVKEGARTLEMGGSYRAVEVVCAEDGTLRQMYGDLEPLAVIDADGTEIVPGRDTRVRAGDKVVLVGTPEETKPFERRRVVHQAAGARAYRPPSGTRSLIRELFALVDAKVKVALVALIGLTVLSVVLLLNGYEGLDGDRMSVVDALYFTVETLGTVGFGDFYFRDQDVWLRVWAIGLMVVGTALMTIMMALLTNALVSRRLEETLGRRRLTGMAGHVIVIGAGSVGLAIVEGLRQRGAEVVVVDADDSFRFRGRLHALGVPVLSADATQPETLASMGLQRALAVAVATSDDLINIETGLGIRDQLGDRWMDVPVAVRIFEPRMANMLATSFGFGNVRSPSALAAPWFVGAALGLDVIATFYVGGQPMLAAGMAVTPSSGLVGLSLLDLPARVLVVSIVHADGSRTYPPRRDSVLAEGDTAHLIGPYEELLRLLLV